MKAFKYILFLLLIAVIGTSIYVAIQPNNFEVSRTRTINAPAEVIYNNVIDFKNWKDWISWVETNPNIELIYPEQTSGINGSYSWQDDSGLGTMTTLEAMPNTSIYQQMTIGDFPASNINWTFTPETDNTTQVTWRISGDNLPFGFKAYTAFAGSMEEQIGSQYERSLEKLDSVVIAQMKKHKITENGVKTYNGCYYIYNSTTCKIDALETNMQTMFSKLHRYASANSITISGASFVNYSQWNETTNQVSFSCGLPTSELEMVNDSTIQSGQIVPFNAVKTTLKGHYNYLKETWDVALKQVTNKGFEFSPNGPMLEIYTTDSSTTLNPANWVTEIYIGINDTTVISNAF